MKKDSKQRIFEVMARLDKTFKPNLNEGFEEIESTEEKDVAIPTEPNEFDSEKKELSIEEKYEEMKNKVDELYALIHGEESHEEESEGEFEEEMNERKKWNFEKKKGEKTESENEEKKEEHEKSETPAEEKKEHGVDENNSKKIPVAAIAKVGK